jgi:predicted secreted protein
MARGPIIQETAMTRATTESFEQLTLEIETATPGTFAKIVGILDVKVTRKANTDSTEVPDATDESKPLTMVKQVRSLEVTLTGSGTWAQESHKLISDWFWSGSAKNIKITHVGALTGDPAVESGFALLTQMDNQRQKGKLVTADLTIEFSDAITIGAAV